MAQSIGLSVRPSRGEPLYQQLFEELVSRIRAGTYPAGFRLPPSRALAEELGVHRNTVVRVYDDLATAGFVESTVGRGTFVVAVPPAVGATTPPGQGSMPWGALVSNALSAEPLARGERLGRSVAPADVIELGRMQPSADLIPTALLARCFEHVLRTAKAKALLYSPREGLLRLRTLVAEDLARQGVPAAAEDLIITSGSQQALDIVARALINPGDVFLADEATYGGALNLLSIAGARVVGVPSDGEGPDLRALERHVSSGAKGLYLMPHCQNPTGARVSRARREALVAWSHRVHVPLIEDDYASDLCLDDTPPLPALRALDGEVIYIGTYSKKLSPALRLGYLLCPRALHPRLAALKHAMDLGSSALMQLALAEFLERGYLQRHLQILCSTYRERRDTLEFALRKALPAEVVWHSPETGVQLWLPLPAGMDPEAFFREALRQGVRVSPGSLNVVLPSEQRGLRLTYCWESTERLAEGARRLGRAWAAMERQGKARAKQSAPRLEVV